MLGSRPNVQGRDMVIHMHTHTHKCKIVYSQNEPDVHRLLTLCQALMHRHVDQ